MSSSAERPRAPRMSDVAELAGVSHQTVSRVLNGVGSVRPATRDRVLAPVEPREPDVTAVFVANDQMALGLVRALREESRAVPDDVSVVGFDDIPEAEFFSPALTTIRQDFAELGRRVMDILGRVLEGEQQPSVDLVSTTLVIRASTAAPPAKPSR